MKIKGVNVITKEEHLFPTLKAAGEFLGIASSGIVKRIINNKPSRDGWLFIRMPLTEEELKKLEKKKRTKKRTEQARFYPR